MPDGQYTTQLQLTFPDEKTRDDFEVALRAFVRDQQQKLTIIRLLQGGGGGGGGSQAGGGGGGHNYGGGGEGGGGGGGTQSGLLRISGYLDFIPGW